MKAILKALHLASVDLDKMENRPKFAEVIARPAYINCPPAIILERLMGKYEYGDGRVEQDPNYMIYSNRNCNYPHQIYGQWWLTQFRRWGMTKSAPDYAGMPKRVLRRDIYLEAMKELGVKVNVPEETEDHALRRRVRRQGSGEVRAGRSPINSLAAERDQSREPEAGAEAVPGGDDVKKRLVNLALPLVRHRPGAGGAGGSPAGYVPDLPSPLRTWEESKLYILEPLTKRGETDQGILLLAYYSLVRVAQGFLLGIAIATPLGFLLGVSPTLTRMFDPMMQVLRPISPLAWLPLGLVLFQKSEPAALFAIAVCSMWPTVINTMMGVRAIPQDYWNVAKVLRLSRTTTFLKIIVPATLPYMFTGYRLSLGIAWLVIVASEMLTGTPGVGGFLWQEYNCLVYAHILLAIVTIGVVGFALDRLMGVAEARLRAV